MYINSSNDTKRARSYEGRQTAERVALWLNRAAGAGIAEATESLRRVVRLLRFLQKLEVLRHKAAAIGVFKNRSSQWEQEQYEAAQSVIQLSSSAEAKAIAQEFSAYKFVLQFDLIELRFLPHPQPHGYSTDIEFGNDYPLGCEPYCESEAVWDSLELSKLGKVWSIRYCDHCAAAYFAKKRDGRFCSDSCKQQFHADAPTTRVKKAAAMRKLRKDEKERNETAKRNVMNVGTSQKGRNS